MGGDLNSLLAWTTAVDLAVDLTEAVKSFKGPGAPSAADQIVRTAESIQANVAEAFGRGFDRYGVVLLGYAHGSAQELIGHLTVSSRARRFAPEAGTDFLDRAGRVRALVWGLKRKYDR